MKVVQINAVYNVKSTGVIVSNINNLLRAANHKSYVVHPDTGEQPSADEIIIGSRIDRLVHAIFTRLTGMQGFASYLATQRVIAKLKKISPDIVHLHNVHSNYLNLSLLLNYTSRYGIPVVLTLHDCWFFTGKCNHFLDVDCDKWMTKCDNCPKKKKEIPNYFFDTSRYIFEKKKKLYHANRLYVVGCSKWIAECARNSPLFDEAQVLQIYNGIDTDVFRPNHGSVRKEYGLADKFVIVTMADKWYLPQNASARLATLKALGKDGKLLLVGCNEIQLQEKDDPAIIKLGYQNDKTRLARIYAAGDLFLNLTLADTLPTVTMEALACDTPVVTYSSGGSAELVSDSVTGYVINTGDIKALQNSIYRIKNGEIQREVCRNYAVNCFNNQNNFTEYLELYQKIYDCSV